MMHFDLTISHALTAMLEDGGYRFFVWVCAEFLILIPILSLAVIWFWPHRARISNAQRSVVISILLCAFLLALKSLAGWLVMRDRPFVVDETLLSLAVNVDQNSFPSAHTMLAFGIALSVHYSGYKNLGRWLVVVAVLVAFGRVAGGVHFASDVIVGALLAWFGAWIIHHESSTLKQYLPK